MNYRFVTTFNIISKDHSRLKIKFLHTKLTVYMIYEYLGNHGTIIHVLYFSFYFQNFKFVENMIIYICHVEIIYLKTIFHLYKQSAITTTTVGHLEMLTPSQIAVNGPQTLMIWWWDEIRSDFKDFTELVLIDTKIPAFILQHNLTFTFTSP